MRIWQKEGEILIFFQASTINRRKFNKIELLKMLSCLGFKAEEIGMNYAIVLRN